MSNWFLTNDRTVRYNMKFNTSTNNYVFSTDLNEENYYFDNKLQEGLFIFGYIMPRVNITEKNTPKNIFELFKLNGFELFNDFKGIFTIVILLNNKALVINDQFGLSKFFYYSNSHRFYISDSISKVILFSDKIVSDINTGLYFVFNYFVHNTTLFKNIFKSTPGISIIVNSSIKAERYFSVNKFIVYNDYQLSLKACKEEILVLWKSILQQYINYFNESDPIISLTAGFDSRMILAGLLKNNYYPATFTFGSPSSPDVKIAKVIAEKFNLKHFHIFPDKEFFENYSSSVIETVYDGESLVSLYRTHRYYAMKKLSVHNKSFFWGFIGSEIIRGSVYPDGLMYSKYVTDNWKQKLLNLKSYLSTEFLNYDSRILKDIAESIEGFSFYANPDKYIFDFIIPLHFAQDVLLLTKYNSNSICPYIDLDFLDLQKKTKYFIDNSKKELFSKRGHFNRRKGPYYSSNILKGLNKDLAKINLGKGYSPSDYAFSKYYASLKFLLFKLFNSKRYNISNFSYDGWFKDYLLTYFGNEKIDVMDINIKNLLNELKNKKVNDELGYLPFVKLINLQLSKNIFY